MKKYLMKFKVNMLLVIVVSLIAGMAGNYFFNNRWLGFFFVALPMCALYIYQTYTEQAEYHKKMNNKHKNKYL